MLLNIVLFIMLGSEENTMYVTYMPLNVLVWHYYFLLVRRLHKKQLEPQILFLKVKKLHSISEEKKYTASKNIWVVFTFRHAIDNWMDGHNSVVSEKLQFFRLQNNVLMMLIGEKTEGPHYSIHPGLPHLVKLWKGLYNVVSPENHIRKTSR